MYHQKQNNSNFNRRTGHKFKKNYKLSKINIVNDDNEYIEISKIKSSNSSDKHEWINVIRNSNKSQNNVNKLNNQYSTKTLGKLDHKAHDINLISGRKFKKKNNISKINIVDDEYIENSRILSSKSSDKPEWINVIKNAKKSQNSVNHNNTNEFVDTYEEHSDIDYGIQHKLKYNYVLWEHDIKNKDWSIKGYKKICELNNVSNFWRFLNNFCKLDYKFHHFFLMKDDTEPIWEHVNNRNGGMCSFKIELDNATNVWENLCIYLANNILSNNSDDINGISFSPKNNWAIIKIWNKSSKNDLTKTLHKDILDIYSRVSIKYKANTPEY